MCKHAAAKAAHQSLVAAMKRERARVDAEWEEIQEGHKAAVEQWLIDVAELKAQGVPKMKWPKKPKWTAKLKPATKKELEACSKRVGKGGEADLKDGKEFEWVSDDGEDGEDGKEDSGNNS